MWRVTFFDVSVDKPQRAMDFYSNVFGWKFKKWDGPFDYWLIETGNKEDPGINGGIAKREEPSQMVIDFIDVPAVDEVARSVVSHGGKIIQEKQSIPGVGYMVIIQDTEGNRFGLMQEDKQAN